MRTPLGKVRGLGSAKEGANHFIKQRVTAIALVVLVPFVLYSLISATSGGYETAAAWVSDPINGIILLLTTGAAFYHMRLGMQVVIEDYIAKHGTRVVLLMLNTFVSIALFAAAAYSIVRIGLAA
jgi:succinate dehydrogenase / fumarate reductase membrane anchor subunit